MTVTQKAIRLPSAPFRAVSPLTIIPRDAAALF
jgi:hypothetical protein